MHIFITVKLMQNASLEIIQTSGVAGVESGITFTVFLSLL